MNYKKIACLLMLSTSLAHASTNTSCNNGTGTPYFSIRSQGVNAVREMVGWEDLINHCNDDGYYFALYGAGEFSQSFSSAQLAQNLFGSDLVTTSCATTTGNGLCSSDCSGGTLTISGSRAATRGPNDWLADYFGLPTDFISTVTFSPRIRNFIADLGFYAGLDAWVKGLYFRAHLPLTNTRWALRATEQIVNPGVNPYALGYFTGAPVNRTNLLNSALSFLGGCNAPTLAGSFTFDDEPTFSTATSFDPLIASKWSTDGDGCKGLSRTRFADIELVFGYNFWCCEDYYFGVNARTELPTGNKPCGQYFFEPIVGNGGHWTVGAGINAKHTFWHTSCENRWSVYLDANITHLFDANQCRSFDLVGKPNSRYMLAQKLTTATNGLDGQAAVGTPPLIPSTLQFANAFTPVANLTTLPIKVSAAVQGDIALKFEYATKCGFTWDFGYNFWGRSCENISLRKKGCANATAALDGLSWALKGDAHVFGFQDSSTNPVIALAATQSNADIHGGKNGFLDNNTAVNAKAITNPGIDNALFAANAGGSIFANTTFITANVTHTSIQPITLAISDVDFSGTSAISHKLFTHFNWTWTDSECYTPFVGAGASVEFGSQQSKKCYNSCFSSCGSLTSSCRRCPLSQWSIWIKGGVSFN